MLDRLLEENHRRHEAEVKAGLVSPDGKKKGRSKRTPSGTSPLLSRMTDTAPTEAAAPPAPAELRAELEQLVVGDLLGPAEGEDERLDARQFRRMRDRYLLGRLAPRDTRGLDPERNDDDGVDGDDGVEDASGDRDGARGATMFPSAFGLSFVVDDSTESVLVTASWGRYEKQSEAAEERRGGVALVAAHPAGGLARGAARRG